MSITSVNLSSLGSGSIAEAAPRVLTPEELVTEHLDEVLAVMEEKAKKQRFADPRDPTYVGSAAEFPWLPGYLIKLNAKERIAGGEKLLKCKIEKNLDLIQIPEQTLYLIPEGRSSSFEALCISKKIEGSLEKNNDWNLSQIQQLITLVKETGIGDLKWKNLVRCGWPSAIGMIDTDAFWGYNWYTLKQLLEWNTFTADARAFLQSEINAMPR